MKKRFRSAVIISSALMLMNVSAPLVSAEGNPDTAYVTDDSGTLPSPGGIKYSSDENSVRLSWKPVEGADGYRVFIYSEDTGKYEICKTVSGTSCRITGLESGREYKFRIASAVRNGKKIIVKKSSGIVRVTTAAAAKVFDFDLLQNSGGKDHETLIANCGFISCKYIPKQGTAQGKVRFLEEECDLYLYFNDNDEMWSFRLDVPLSDDNFKLLVSEMGHYYNEKLETEVYYNSGTEMTYAIYYDDSKNTAIINCFFTGIAN